MHREEIEVTPYLRKHRIYIGQGIPDLWMAYPFCKKIETIPHSKFTEKALGSCEKGRCLCCEREYLFECPDKCTSDSLDCSCQDCHKKNPSTTVFSKKCNCSEIFHKQRTENRTLRRRQKKQRPKRGPEGDISENGLDSDSEDENLKEKNKFAGSCECHRNHEIYGSSEKSSPRSTDLKSKGKPFKFKSKRCKAFKEHLRVCVCPQTRNFYQIKKFLEKDSHKLSSVEPKMSVSKEIQTEILPVKFSKTVQTEKWKTKSQSKCTCYNKCICCNIFGHDVPCIKRSGYHSIPNCSCSSSYMCNPAYVCPYFLSKHFCKQNICKCDAPEIKMQHKRKKQNKQTESEEGLDIKLGFDRQDSRGMANKLASENKIKEGTQDNEFVDVNNDFKFCNTYSSQTLPSISDHLKNLSKYKLKGYLPQEEISFKISHEDLHSCSKFRNY